MKEMMNHRFQGRLLLLMVVLMFFMSGVKAQKIWTLEDCVNYALENNLDINRQLLTVEATRSNLLQSGLNMLPSLNLGGTNVWNFGQTIDQYTNTFANTTVRSNNFYISSNLTLFGGLQKLNTYQANKINLMASQYDLDVLKNSISLSVAGYYLDILFSMELLEVAREQLRITTTQVDRMQKLVDAGSAAQGDLLNIKAQKAAEELSMTDASNRLYISNLTLQQLIDLPVSPDFQIEKPNLKEVRQPKEKINAEVIYDHAVNTRPEIKGAELRVELAKKRLDIARGYVMPTLTFSGSWATGYSGAYQETDPSVPSDTIGYLATKIHPADPDFLYLPQIKKATRLKSFGDQLWDNNNKSLGFNLNIPIFNGWSGRTAISQAKIQKSQADIDLNKAKRDLRKLIEQAFADASAALQKYNSAEEKVNAQQEAFKYSQQKFDVGVMTAIDYNTSKKDLAKAVSDRLQAKFDFIFKTTILDFYMGNPIRIERQ